MSVRLGREPRGRSALRRRAAGVRAYRGLLSPARRYDVSSAYVPAVSPAHAKCFIVPLICPRTWARTSCTQSCRGVTPYRSRGLLFGLPFLMTCFTTASFAYAQLRGGFLRETKVCTVVSQRARPAAPGDDDDVRDTLVTKQGIQTDFSEGRGVLDSRSVDHSQLHQSRFGLISQALMLIIIAGFLASETLSEFWKAKVPVVSRNWHDLVFRLAEIGVALWFPCVLWNSMAPERLWLLNPRRLLARQLDDSRLNELLQQAASRKCRTRLIVSQAPRVRRRPPRAPSTGLLHFQFSEETFLDSTNR
ncbi:hypothetical protein EVAR_40507_1 [Eumeta japonica]|uniref:Uncharacterized protein n=1 Tax=Eumeta variegata TaxID=151549 RepID=A0A4C1XUT2_EUMVA|nr:hypothetical protein EVAR_40507_1 [Eumeta japonica]